jgi:hypothetical protein
MGCNFIHNFIVGTLQAQTESGNMVLGRNLSFYSTSYQGSNAKNNGMTFSPSFGYFLKDNLAVGISATAKTRSLYISPGFLYFFSKHWAGELSFSGFVFPNTIMATKKASSYNLGLDSLHPL